VFSERLHKCRELRDLTQARLAELANIPTASISHFENGVRFPSGESIRRLADALNVSTDYLLGRTAQIGGPESGTAGPLVGAILEHAEGLSQDALESLEAFGRALVEKEHRRRPSPTRADEPNE
jgi:transcriptional regulator with XRE-family HTH domain